MMLDEMMHGLRLGRRDPVRFMNLARMLRDAFPWLYELGVDAYRASIDGNKTRQADAVSRFVQAVRLLRRGPLLDEVGFDKSTYNMVRQMEHMLLQESEALEEVTPEADKPSVPERS
jgi:hypothetical protein